jgi:group I intron endonuclease
MSELHNNNIGIYKLINKENGKFFIGSSNQLNKVMENHLNDFKNKCHTNTKLAMAFERSGFENFEFSIIEYVPVEQLKEKELYYIELIGSFRKERGYNITKDTNDLPGMFGKTHSVETIEKQKEKSVGRFTLEWFESKFSKEEAAFQYEKRNKIIENREMNYSRPSPFKGLKRRPKTQEEKDKISSSKLEFKMKIPALYEDIRKGELSTRKLSIKYGVTKEAIRYHQKKIEEAAKNDLLN